MIIMCYNCCKIHLSILKYVKLSNDFLEEKIHSQLSAYHGTSTDRLTKSILRAVYVVSDNLLHHCVLLLSQVSQVFIEEYGISASTATTDLVFRGSVKYLSGVGSFIILCFTCTPTRNANVPQHTLHCGNIACPIVGVYSCGMWMYKGLPPPETSG